MKQLFESKIALTTGVIGLIGGIAWALSTNGDVEALITASVSFVLVIGNLASTFMEDTQSIPVSESQSTQTITQSPSQTQTVYLTVNNDEKKDVQKKPEDIPTAMDREAIINNMQSKTRILFIDDDKNFNVVKLLKNSGWKHTKTVTDVKTLETPYVKESDVIFVDINGVGVQLNLPAEGLDLALMLKQKYPEKKVIIYSANKKNDVFHNAWSVCDYKLEKNALPYQFQNLVEEYSIDIYNKN